MTQQTRHTFTEGHARAPKLNTRGGTPNWTRGFEDGTAFCATKGEAFGRYVEYMGGNKSAQESIDQWVASQKSAQAQASNKTASVEAKPKASKKAAKKAKAPKPTASAEVIAIVEAVNASRTPTKTASAHYRAAIQATLASDPVAALNEYKAKLTVPAEGQRPSPRREAVTALIAHLS
jgi:hypothetical protein